MLGEWVVAVLGPHFAAALVARDLGDDGPDMDRTFDLVLEVARSMMSRVVPVAG